MMKRGTLLADVATVRQVVRLATGLTVVDLTGLVVSTSHNRRASVLSFDSSVGIDCELGQEKDIRSTITLNANIRRAPARISLERVTYLQSDM
jgi:hypothetical protein